MEKILSAYDVLSSLDKIEVINLLNKLKEFPFNEVKEEQFMDIKSKIIINTDFINNFESYSDFLNTLSSQGYNSDMMKMCID